MAKSNLVLLQEAIASGDLEKAKELTEKLAKANAPKKAPRKPAKASKAAKATRAPRKSKDASNEELESPEDIPASRMDDSSYIATSRSPYADDVLGERHFIGADGKQHTRARRVSMAGTKFVNKFSPEGYVDLSPKEKKLEKQINNLRRTPRPGEPGARDVAKKIDVQCSICNNWVKVYPWEAQRVPGDDGESNFRCSRKRCTTYGR